MDQADNIVIIWSTIVIISYVNNIYNNEIELNKIVESPNITKGQLNLLPACVDVEPNVSATDVKRSSKNVGSNFHISGPICLA